MMGMSVNLKVLDKIATFDARLYTPKYIFPRFIWVTITLNLILTEKLIKFTSAFFYVEFHFEKKTSIKIPSSE